MSHANRSFFENSAEAFSSNESQSLATLLSKDIWGGMRDGTNIFSRQSDSRMNSANAYDSSVLAHGNQMRTGDGSLALGSLFIVGDGNQWGSSGDNETGDAYSGSGGGGRGDAPPITNEQKQRALIETALQKAGQPVTRANVAAVDKIIEKESSWDPDVVNRWDSNAKKGTPSKGLMQTIEPTFHRYKIPGHGNIMRPIDNMIAGIRYAVDRYGSLHNVPGIRAMSRGKAYRGY